MCHGTATQRNAAKGQVCLLVNSLARLQFVTEERTESGLRGFVRADRSFSVRTQWQPYHAKYP